MLSGGIAEALLGGSDGAIGHGSHGIQNPCNPWLLLISELFDEKP
jgi:hypothetical protein